MKLALLPAEVLEQWETTFGPLSESSREIILQYAPPITPSAVRHLANWTGDEQWLALLPLGPEHPDPPPKMPYALYWTYRQFEDVHQSRRVRDLAAELLGGDLPDEADGETYYRDCTSVRRTLDKWLSVKSPTNDYKDDLRCWLEEESRVDRSNRSSSATITLRLLQGERKAGVKRHSRTAPIYSAEHLSRLRRSPKNAETDTPRRRRAPAGRRIDRSQNLIESTYPSFRIVEPAEKLDQHAQVTEGSDPDTPITLQRRKADLRTPRDDKRSLARMAWLESLSVSPTEFDIHRTPAAHVVTALATLHRRNEMIAWSFVWLIATTGIPPSRLRKTRVDLNSSFTLLNDEDIRVDIARGVLECRLLDGPSGAPDANNRLVRLALPADVIAALQPAAIKLQHLDPAFPFREAESHANGILRRNHKTAGGLTVTCQRIRAAAEGMILGLALDTTSGLALTGKYGHSNRGPAAYRVIDREELQSLFCQVTEKIATLGSLHASREPSAAFPKAPHAPPPGTDETFGSAKALAIETVPAVFEHLAALARALCERTETEQGITGVRLATLVSIQNTSALHTYLGLMLGTGIRPVADRTVLSSFGPDLWLVADKDSVDFVERRVVPALPVVRQQLEIHRELTDEIRLTLNRRGQPVRDKEPSESSLPLLIEQTTRQSVTRRVRQADFMSIAPQYGWDRRATRHTFATELRDQVPASELNALLGHAGGGWHRHGTSSMAHQLFTPPTLDAIERLLDQAGFRPLDLRRRYVT